MLQNSLYYFLYLHKSIFLVYINNEVNHSKKNQYYDRFSGLDRLMLVQFEEDTTVYPKESE